jgi:2-polyprenyl-3-methyl-5-hydroxy-6-metoxy-1,4-benzoquinol methylase
VGLIKLRQQVSDRVMDPNDINTENLPEAAEWHMRLYRKSLHKQAKLRNILSLMPSPGGKGCIDVGGDNGVISYLLRQEGGTWQSVDLTEKAVNSIGQLVGEDQAHLIEDNRLPFDDQVADLIVIIDYLEHVEADEAFAKECHRVLKEDGILLVNVPFRKRMSLIRGIRKILGLTDAMHGHVRPGYSEAELYNVLKNGFDVPKAKTYNKFFIELVDTGVQFLGTFIKSSHDDGGSKGNLIDQEDFSRHIKAFRLYSFIYPFLWLAAKLDFFLFWTQGHSLVVLAHRRSWKPRRGVKIADGRSIAEASIRTKIGTAADLKQRA